MYSSLKKTISLALFIVMLVLSCSAFAEERLELVVKEEDGGEFRPLPLNLDGGSPVPMEFEDRWRYAVYEDPTIRVERYDVKDPNYQVTYWYALITIRDPSQLRTASASESNPFLDSVINPGFVIARRKRAVLAINGDYCASFSGENHNNYVLRQGTVYRDSVTENLDILLIDEDGDFHVLSADDTDLESVDKTQINGKNVINALQFGPALVINGEKVPDEIILNPERSPTFAEPQGRAQRTIICQIDELHYMALCCAFWGMNLADLRDLAMSLAPVKIVYVLDGGRSSQIMFLGDWWNAGSNGNDEARGLTDIIYFASAWFKK